MPGKARRVASRQAQLNQRRRRQQRGPRGIPTAAVEPILHDGQDNAGIATHAMGPEAPAQARPRSTTSPTPAAGRTSTAALRPSGPLRGRREHAPGVNYVGAELRRILVYAGLVLVALLALAVASWYLPVWYL